MFRAIPKVMLKVLSGVFTSSVIAAVLVSLPSQSVRSEEVIPQNANSSIRAKQDKGISLLFTNRTGSTLTSLQVAPGKTRRWNDNILDKDLLDGQERSIKVSEGQKDCRRDIRATFSNGTTIEDFDVDVCKNDIYTFTVSGLW
jgi:hypothetical protein